MGCGMPRGGRREGAGRKPALDFFETLRVGGLCEERWRQDIQARLTKQQRQFVEEDTALQDFWDKVNAKSQAERKAWLASTEASEHSKSVDEELHSRGQGRFVSFRVSAPYGKRKTIIECVARANGLTHRCVEEAWKQFRAFERRLRKDSADHESSDGSIARAPGPDDPPDDGGTSLV
jgi:hypothetical protein